MLGCSINEKHVRDNKTEEIINTISKFEKVADLFQISIKGENLEGTLKKLNGFRNHVFWNNEAGSLSENTTVKYPVIVNDEGISLETNFKLIDTAFLVKEKKLFCKKIL